MRPLHALLTTTLVLASCNSVPGGGPSSDASDALARVVDLEWEDRLREDAREERADGEAAGLRQVGAADHARRAEKAAEFLAHRPVPLAHYKRAMLEEGRAVFDSQRRSQGFVQFMRTRSQPQLDDEVFDRLLAVAC